MANFEGSIGTPSGKFNLMVEYSISQSVEGNYSDVSATAYVKRNDSNYWPYNGYGGDGNLTIDGDNKYERVAYDLRTDGYKQIMSHSKRVYHNNDGTKSINISFSFDGRLSSGYPYGNISQNIVLPTIARASDISCSSPYIGDSATITISKKSSSFTSTIWYVFGNVTNTIATKTYDTVVAFNTSSVKSQLYAQIPNSQSGYGTMYCETFSGNTSIGTKSCTFYLYAKESDCKPTLSISVVDTNSDVTTLLGSNTKFLKYLSKPQVTFTMTAKYSSSISSYTMGVDNKYYYTSPKTFDTIESNIITGYVRDSRGFTTNVSKTLDMVDYIKLHIDKFEVSRPEGVSTQAYLNISGAWYNEAIGQGTLLRNIQVGDDLSGKTVYFQIPENCVEELKNKASGSYDYSETVISCGNNNYFEEYYWWSRNERGGGLILHSNGQSNTNIYEKSFEQYGEDPETTVSYTNLSSIVLSNEFGTVTSINQNTAMYQYIYIVEDNNSLAMELLYKLPSASNWTTYGTLTPTISGNTFQISNLSLGNNYSIENEYQFKIIITDDADEIYQIEVLPKGQEVITIGDEKIWLYGDVFINDFSLVNQYSTNEVKTNEKFVDGKPIYRKTIYVDELPNGYNDSGIKSIATGISNMDIMVDMYGTYTGTGNHYYEKYPINYIRRDNSIYDISTEYGYYDGAMSIIIRSTMGSGYIGYVTLKYTKTTD